MSTGYDVKIIEHGTDRVERSLGPYYSERQAERAEDVDAADKILDILRDAGWSPSE